MRWLSSLGLKVEPAFVGLACQALSNVVEVNGVFLFSASFFGSCVASNRVGYSTEESVYRNSVGRLGLVVFGLVAAFLSSEHQHSDHAAYVPRRQVPSQLIAADPKVNHLC